MPQIIVLGGNPEVARLLIEAHESESLRGELQTDLTFAEVKQEVDRLIEVPGEYRVLPGSALAAMFTIPVWFQLATMSERVPIHYAGDIVLLHGSEKEDPWCKISFVPQHRHLPLPV